MLPAPWTPPNRRLPNRRLPKHRLPNRCLPKQLPTARLGPAPPTTASTPQAKTTLKSRRGPLSAAMTQKEKKRQRLEAAFKDYFDFRESLTRIPPHRVLAINRGERMRILRQTRRGHRIHGGRSRGAVDSGRPSPPRIPRRLCTGSPLARLVLPSLERELRREMTEKAESMPWTCLLATCANYLLQPPVLQSPLIGHRSRLSQRLQAGCHWTNSVMRWVTRSFMSLARKSGYVMLR